jgi:hypothetical protein
MKVDGTEYPGPGTRITWFGDPSSPDYVPHSFGGECDWLDEDTAILMSGRWYGTFYVEYFDAAIYLVGIPAPAPR